MTLQNTSDMNLELLKVLTNSVRILTAQQAQKATGEPVIERVKNRLRRLQTKGLLQLSTAWICPPDLGVAPLVSWGSHGPPPSFKELARTAYRRWSAERLPEMIAVATAEARNLYGAVKIRGPRESETAHDVWVAELFLSRYAHHPLYSWLHEDGFGETFPEGNRADAALIGSGKNPKVIAVELLGNYRSGKIEQYHNYCQEHGISYEIW